MARSLYVLGSWSLACTVLSMNRSLVSCPKSARTSSVRGGLGDTVEVAWHPLCGGEERLLVSLKPEDEDTASRIHLPGPSHFGGSADPRRARHLRSLRPVGSADRRSPLEADRPRRGGVTG